jgi:hypothetical protein
MIEGTRPFLTAQVHINLINELKVRKQQIIDETDRPISGGLPLVSQLAAEELRYMRMSGEELNNLLKSLDVNIIQIEQFGEKRSFVCYEDFKKFFRIATALNKKKDQNQIRLEIQKIKGLKKNEVKFLW